MSHSNASLPNVVIAVPGGPSIATECCPEPAAAATYTGSAKPHVRDSLGYRLRIPFTIACMVSGLTVRLLSPPEAAPASVWDVAQLALGGMLVVVGIGLRLWALSTISGRKSVQLVTTGPYSLCRNPLYVGSLLILAGFLVQWQSVALLLGAIPCLVLYAVCVVPQEEQVLLARFGQEFEAYRARVPRWMPLWTGYVSEGRPIMSDRGFRKELQSAFWWMVIVAVTAWFVLSGG